MICFYNLQSSHPHLGQQNTLHQWSSNLNPEIPTDGSLQCFASTPYMREKQLRWDLLHSSNIAMGQIRYYVWWACKERLWFFSIATLIYQKGICSNLSVSPCYRSRRPEQELKNYPDVKSGCIQYIYIEAKGLRSKVHIYAKQFTHSYYFYLSLKNRCLTLPETNIAHENPTFPGKYH